MNPDTPPKKKKKKRLPHAQERGEVNYVCAKSLNTDLSKSADVVSWQTSFEIL